MSGQSLSSAAMAPATPKKGAGEGWTFLAPRHGDLVACPYCANRLTRCCDYCGDEGKLFAMDLPENLHG